MAAFDRRELAAIFVGGAIGGLVRAAPRNIHGPRPVRMAVADLHRQHRGGGTARLFHDTTARAFATLEATGGPSLARECAAV